ADVALIQMNVMDAVKAVDVAELDVDRLVQVTIELCAKNVDLAASRLALIEIERQQILQVVGARAAGRRQRAAMRPVEERRLDVVEPVAGITSHRAESRRASRKGSEQGMAREWVDDPERHL